VSIGSTNLHAATPCQAVWEIWTLPHRTNEETLPCKTATKSGQ